ncbi:MAG: hypothetical protein IPK32_09455 [Verrucomicrobiaceae bacterium]|nr:hypothetical protein [Verrucomicrobiaceae bacterium]
MSTEAITFLNFIVHSLVIGAVAWLLVRFVIRDALRRCILANLAVLMCLYSPFDITFRDLFPTKQHVPVLTPIRETFEHDWRVKVEPQTASVQPAPRPAAISAWNVNDLVKWVHRLSWLVTALLLLWLLVQSISIQRWAWRLRGLTQSEIDSLPRDVPFERLSVSEAPCTPCAAGWFFPVIAVPAQAFQELSPQQWRWLIRHEAEHLRLNDTVAVLLQNIALTFLWWNPFVHALIEEFARAREEACDTAAVGEEPDHAPYADFLLTWAGQPSPSRFAMPLLRSRPARRLKDRLVALMEARGVRKKIGALFVLGCLAFALVTPYLAASFGIATAQAAAPQPGKMFTRHYRVPPGFAEGSTARDFLEKRGIPFPEGSSALYQIATSTLLVRNWSTNLDLIEEIVARASERSPQVFFLTRLIQGGPLLSQHAAIIQKGEFQKLIRESTQQKDIHILSAPSVITKLGQRATVEVVREILKMPPDEQKGAEMKKLGPSIELLAAATDTAKSRVEANVSLGLDANEGMSDAHAVWEHVTMHQTSAIADLASGETLVLHLTTPKKPVTVFITAMAINPGGEETSFDDKGPRPPPGRNMPDKPSLEIAQRTYRLPAILQNTTNLVTMLREQKIVIAPGDASIQEGKLTVKASKATLELIEEWLGILNADHDRANKRIVLVVKAVSVNMPWEAFLDILQSGAVKKTSDSKPAEPAPPLGIFLSGVLTDPQFQVVMRSLSVKKETSINVLPRASAKPGVESTFRTPAEFGVQKLAITPTLGADGNTIELNINIKPGNTTSVTIWDGQTVVLSESTGQTTRCLFISAQLISPLPKK